MTTTVQLAVNQGNLFANLKMAFGSKVTFLAELMQNSRRSGATEVCIKFDQETETLTIGDNGSGIQEFQKLFTVAESGWSEELQQKEGPYGMGFLAALFACKKITVSSFGQRIEVDTAEMMGGKHHAVTPCIDAPESGTEIVMSGVDFTSDVIVSAVNSFARGFPIAVKFNGEALQRNHAEDSMVMFETSIGRIGVCREELDSYVTYMCRGGWWYGSAVSKVATYLQGLPIQMGYSNGEKPCFIVHLDSKVKGKLPDRQTVVDADSWNDELNTCIKLVFKSWLEMRHKELGDDAFVRRAWAVAKDIHPELLNRIPVLPPYMAVDINAVQCSSEYATTLSVLDDNMTIRKGNPEGLPIALAKGVRVDLDGWATSSIELTYAHLMKLWVIDSSALPKGHWAFESFPSLTEAVTAEVKNGGEPFFTESDCCVDVQFALCDSIELSGPFGSVSTDEDEVAVWKRETECRWNIYSMWTPANVRHPGCGIEQLKTYTVDDCYDEGLHDQDLKELAIQIRQKRGFSAHGLLQASLADLYLQAQSLNGKSFKVSILNGRIVVDEELEVSPTPTADSAVAVQP